ncbi:MAG: LamG domain-containing protein, partial [Terracidiphilus sp.]
FSTFTTGPAIPVNGVCGSANGQTVATPPTTNLCSAGTASSLLNNAGTVSWTCNGESTGTNASCSATITPAQACYAAPSGLVSWWKGDNSALDQQGLNNGTLENGVTYGLGEVNNAFSLNGSDQYVLIGQPVPASLQFQSAMTLSAWINPTAIPSISSGGYYGLIVGGQYAGSTAGAGVYINGPNYNSPADAPPGGIVWVIGDGSHWYEAYTTTQVPLNQWTLVTATASAGNPLQVYFNGVAQPVVNNGTTTTWTGTASYTNSWFAIGQEDYYNRPFTGLIDEVQAYDTALTAAQIQGIYNAGDAGVCP